MQSLVKASEMQGQDNADSMPHGNLIPDHIMANDGANVGAHMNAYAGGVPGDTIVWDTSKVSGKALIPSTHDGNQKKKNSTEMAGNPKLSKTVDEVMGMLKSIKFMFVEEDKRDASASYADRETSSHVVSARTHHQDAVDNVANMHIAEDSNATMHAKMSEYKAKVTQLNELLDEKASLTKEEGMIRLPILKQLTTISSLQRKTSTAKQKALNDFALHPSLSETEKNQMINTYNMILVNLKQQEAVLHEQASEGLVPVQLNVNQTSNSVARLKAETLELRHQITSLITAGQKFSVEALAVSMAIEADSGAHLQSLLDARHEEETAFASRASDRNDIVRLIDDLIMSVDNVHPPQE